jgi:hypothetical protein
MQHFYCYFSIPSKEEPSIVGLGDRPRALSTSRSRSHLKSSTEATRICYNFQHSQNITPAGTHLHRDISPDLSRGENKKLDI